jgi:hypothetical protein
MKKAKIVRCFASFFFFPACTEFSKVKQSKKEALLTFKMKRSAENFELSTCFATD